MTTDSAAGQRCCFCGGTAPVQTHLGLYHPFKKDHGPFNFHRCPDCGSGLTLPPPTREQLSQLYGSFHDGWAGELRDMMRGDPQRAVYARQVRRIFLHAGRAGLDLRTWIDVGAGGVKLPRFGGR